MQRTPANPPPLPASSQAQSGMTLLFTLGFLSFMLSMMLSLVTVGRSQQRSASGTSDSVRTRLIAGSAMERALAELRVGCKGQLFPADSFIAPDDGSAWEERRLLTGRDASGTEGDLKSGLDDAVSAVVSGMQLTPHGAPSADATWIPVLSSVVDEGETTTAIIGRYNYVLLDESGRIDPGAVVRREQSEQSDLAVRLGYPVSDIALGDLGFTNPDAFNYQDADFPGKMPDVGRWFSVAHMVRSMGLSQQDVDLATRTLHPFSNDTEMLWRDRNDNGRWDVGEDSPRFNIVAETDPSVLYHQFVGAAQSFWATADDGTNAGSDDCAWLKQLDSSPWFRNWRDRIFADYAEPERTFRARAAVAAQVAVNIRDYADPDSEPTSVYLGSDGDIHLGSASATLTLHGIENNWGVSEVTMRVQGDIVLSEKEQKSKDTETTPDSSEDIDFDVIGGHVVPREAYEASVTVLGVQLGMYDMNYTPARFMYWCGVTADVELGKDILQPWGDYTNCNDNNLNDENNPRNYDIPDTYPAGTRIAVRSRYYSHTQTYDSSTQRYVTSPSWSCFEALESDKSRQQVKVLRDGAPLPEITTASNQNQAAYYLEDYVENGRISLQPNQAIFLHETNTSKSGMGQDFQDLVVLVTLRRANPPARPKITTTFTIDGEVNINPNNGADQFYITKPGGSQITRDDLHKYGQDYTGPATWIHVRPKGNGNENSITLNGVNYPLRNGRTYDFSGSFNIHLYNDKYVDGKAMGHWWIDLDGAFVIVVDEGQTYAIEEEPVEEEAVPPVEETTTVITPGEDATGMQIGSTGSNLRVRAGFQVELFYPFGEDEHLEFPPESVTVQYTVKLATAAGQTLNHTGTVDVLPATASNVDGGTLLWTPEYSNGDWLVIKNAFAKDQEPALDTYVITMARIDSIVIHDRLGEVVDRVPSSSGPLCSWASSSATNTDQNFFANGSSYDPLMNDRGQDRADFDLFWNMVPVDRTLVEGDDSELGTIGNFSGGYNTSPYSGIRAKNAPLERLGELGRVHSYEPNRSLRLWSASSGDEGGHDADILDLFKVGDDVHTRGKVNINTLQRQVLTALFDNCTTVPTSTAVDALLAYRRSVGPFTSIGEAFGAISQITGSNTTQDAFEEGAIAALAEKLTVRQTYFRVVVCAQAVKDTQGRPYRAKDGVRTTSRLGRLDVAYSTDGTFLRNMDEIQAEEKLMAVVYRDAFSGELRIEHVELLNE
ncbi:MAG: hypothetical protein HN380_15295 [Victivallales bacterium]|nr:hypothetical protein [Victivallales bacterium]